MNVEKLSYERYIKHVPTCEFVVFKPKPEHDPNSKGEVEGDGKKYYQFVYGEGLGHKPYAEPDNVSLNLNY